MNATCLRLLAAFLALLVVVVPAARPCGQRFVYHAPVVVEKKVEVVEEFVPVAVVLPAVAVGYAPAVVPASAPAAPATLQPAVGSASSPSEVELASLRKELAELRALLHGPASTPPAGGPSLQARSCVLCHGRTAAADGGGHRFYDDAGKLLPGAPVGRMIAKVYDGEMPKLDARKGTKPYGDADVAAFVHEMR